jgi:hypothetical protein
MKIGQAVFCLALLPSSSMAGAQSSQCNLIFRQTGASSQAALQSGNIEFEVSAVHSGAITVGSWAESKTPFDGASPTSIGIGIAEPGSGLLKKVAHLRDPRYPVNINPALTIDRQGVIHLVFLSGAADQSAGALNYSKSIDKGATWTPVVQIAESKGSILDKPSIQSSADGALTVAFADIKVKLTPDGKSAESIDSKTRMLRFDKRGQNWSSIDIPTPAKIGSAHGYNGFQGQYLRNQNDSWQFSLAEYGGGGIYFDQKSNPGDLFHHPVRVGVHSVMAPITQVFGTGPSLGVLWYGAHYFQTVSFALSENNGASWGKEIRVSDSGTLGAAAIIGNRIAVLLNEKVAEKVQTKVKIYDMNGNSLSENLLSEIRAPGSDVYIGAEQSLVASEDGKTLLAYWIDYSNAGKLMISRIPIQ